MKLIEACRAAVEKQMYNSFDFREDKLRKTFSMKQIYCSSVYT